MIRMVPALTEEEWADVDPEADDSWENGHAEQMGRQQAAARALHKQPFGFTHEGLTALRECIEVAISQRPHPDETIRQALLEAHKIQALLPEEK